MDGPRVFDGAWFSGWASHGGVAGTLNFNLYDGNHNLLATSNTLQVPATPVFLGSGYSGLVASVGVSSSLPQYWIMDDVQYDDGLDPAAVPEPTSLVLLGTGLLGAVRSLRKRRT